MDFVHTCPSFPKDFHRSRILFFCSKSVLFFSGTKWTIPRDFLVWCKVKWTSTKWENPWDFSAGCDLNIKIQISVLFGNHRFENKPVPSQQIPGNLSFGGGPFDLASNWKFQGFWILKPQESWFLCLYKTQESRFLWFENTEIMVLGFWEHKVSGKSTHYCFLKILGS